MQVKNEEKPNGVYFEIRKKNEDEEKKKSKIESCSFTILCTKKESKFIDFVDDNRLFLFRFFLFKSRINILHKIYIYIHLYM